MKKRLFVLMILAGSMALASCQKEENMEEELMFGERSWDLAIEARKGNPATEQLMSVWTPGEEVMVYMGDTFVGTLTATPKEDPRYATLAGTVHTAGILVKSSEFTLVTLRPEVDYTGQVGKLLIADEDEGEENQKSIERLFNYAVASSVLVTKASGNNLSTELADFTCPQSICKISFRYGSSPAPVATKSVTISGATGKLVRSLVPGGETEYGSITVTLGTASASPFYVALRNEDKAGEAVLNFVVVDADGVTYKGSKAVNASQTDVVVDLQDVSLTSRLGMSLGAKEVKGVL